MNRTSVWNAVLAAIVAAGLVTAPGFAQRRGGQGKGLPKYSPSTEVTVQGTVEEVSEHASPMGWPGTHLTVKAEKETLEVHLGPSSFLGDKKFSFAKGDRIEVTGSKIKFEGADALLAREVKKGGQTLTLRDAQGIPLWSRTRRR